MEMLTVTVSLDEVFLQYGVPFIIDAVFSFYLFFYRGEQLCLMKKGGENVWL